VTDGIWDIVEFQVEKHLGPGGTHFPNDVRPRRGEKLIANLEKADSSPDCFDEFAGGLRRRNI